jgi:UDP-N-acetylmuramate dehydrogenase
MTLFAGLEQIVRADEPLAERTWFGIGGPAEHFVEPRTHEELAEVVRRCRQEGVPVHVLGDGANLLIDDAGVKGAVVHLAKGVFADVAVQGGAVRAGAGADVGKLVLRCVREGLSGMEGVTGVPGSLGGCIRMNAGGFYGNIGSAVERVTLMSEDGEVFERGREDLLFGYRESNIAAPFILGAELRLSEDDPHRVLRQVKQIWIHKKNTQPLGERSAGSVFRNPQEPGVPAAGALIDRAGLKGRRIGGARVSEKHANFILADEGAKASDVLKLVALIQETVYRNYKVYLHLEIVVW